MRTHCANVGRRAHLGQAQLPGDLTGCPALGSKGRAQLVVLCMQSSPFRVGRPILPAKNAIEAVSRGCAAWQGSPQESCQPPATPK